MQNTPNKGIKYQMPQPWSKIEKLICDLVINSSLLSKQRNFQFCSEKNIGTKIPNNEIIREFDRLFRGDNIKEKVTIEEYLHRILFQPGLRDQVFLYAGYLFYKILLTPGIYTDFEESEYKFKLFATCIYIAQKYHLDNNYRCKDVGKVLGLKPRSINEKELFIYFRIFRCELGLKEKSIQNFKAILKSLPIRLQNLNTKNISLNLIFSD